MNYLVAVLVAASAVASAQPREERGGPVPYGDRWERWHPPRTPQGQWIPLSPATATRFGSRMFVLADDASAMRTLRLDVVSGTVLLRSIRVFYRHGPPSTFTLQRTLGVNQVAFIDLGQPRDIDRIQVTTAVRPRGSYVIAGSPRPPPNAVLVSQR